MQEQTAQIVKRQRHLKPCAISTRQWFIVADNIKLSVDIRIVKTKVAWYYIETVSPQANGQDHLWEVYQRCLELIIDTLNNVDARKRAEFEMLNIEEVETLDNPIKH